MALQSTSRTAVAAALALAVVLSGCAAVPLASDDVTAKQIGERAQQKYESIENYRGTVTSSIRSESRNVTTKARVWVELGSNRMRYEYVAPEAQAGSVTVSNGSVMWSYNASENAVRRTDISGLSTGTTAVNYTRLFENVFENYEVSHEGSATVDGREAYVVELTPKENASVSGIVSERTLWIDEERWFPVKTETKMSLDNETTVVTSEYTNLSFDVEIPDGTFEFEPPANATVEENELPDVRQFDSTADADAATPRRRWTCPNRPPCRTATSSPARRCRTPRSTNR